MSDNTQRTSNITKKKVYLVAAISFILGIVWFIAIRLVTYSSDSDHFHANFALYIDGEKEDFKEEVFYEEVSSCGEIDNNPLTRVHMHDNIGSVVHVHDASATWSNFFENLGLTLGDEVLSVRGKTYVDGENGQLMFFLNGQRVRTLSGKNIQSEDKLLISFDESSAVLSDQYQSVESTAKEYNEKSDPSACKGSDDGSIIGRLKNILGLN